MCRITSQVTEPDQRINVANIFPSYMDNSLWNFSLSFRKVNSDPTPNYFIRQCSGLRPPILCFKNVIQKHILKHETVFSISAAVFQFYSEWEMKKRMFFFYIFNWLWKNFKIKSCFKSISKRHYYEQFTILPIVALYQSQSSWDRKPKPQKLRLSSYTGLFREKACQSLIYNSQDDLIFMFFRRAGKKMNNYQMKVRSAYNICDKIANFRCFDPKTFTELHTMKSIILEMLERCFKPLVTIRSVDVPRL